MAELLDYINWRGDIPCSIAPYNNADYYIISKLGCPDFDGIIPADENSIGLGEAAASFFSTGRSTGVLTSQYIFEALHILPQTMRFKEIRLSGFRQILNDENSEQFSALTLLLPDGTVFISFRGTDDTFVAWREDMLLAVKEPVSAQQDALAYLNWATAHYSGPIILGGHSKGGNMAIFAASKAESEIQERILSVYSYDSPGFKPSFYEQEGYQAIRSRLHEIVPQTSMVGVLLYKEKETEIISCFKNGIASHDGYQWETSPSGFLRADNLTAQSLALHEATNEVLSKMSAEEINDFIRETFDILQARGARTLTELSEQHLLEALEMAVSLNRAKPVKNFSVKVFEAMIRCLLSETIPPIHPHPFSHFSRHGSEQS